MEVSTLRPNPGGQLTRQEIKQDAGNRGNRQGENPASRIMAVSQAARRHSEQQINSEQLAPYKRPQPELLAPPPQGRITLNSITERFEALFQEQVEKGRIVDVRV